MEQFSGLKASLASSQGAYHQLPSNSLASDSDALLSQSLQDEEGQGAIPPSRRFEMLYHRSTYYWIAFVSLTLELLLEVMALYLSAKGGKADDANFSRFFVTGFYSLLCLLVAGILLWWQYKKQNNTTSPSTVTALAHVAFCAMICLLCAFMIVLIFILDKSMDDFPSGDIRWIFVPLMILLLIVTMAALCIAARITYCAAVRVRGTQLVPIIRPTRTALAWTLATTSESQSISIKRPLKKGTRGQGTYQPLPTSDLYNHDSDSELITGTALQVEEKRLHRSTYYRLAFGSLSIELILGIVGLCNSGGGGKQEDSNVALFVVTTAYSVLALGSLSILLRWQRNLQINTNPPSKVNALAHISLSICTSGMCFFCIVFLCILGVPTGEYPIGDTRNNIAQLMVLLLLGTIGTLCFASWITYRAAVQARGTERVPLPPLPTRTVAAWTQATTSESQSILP